MKVVKIEINVCCSATCKKSHFFLKQKQNTGADRLQTCGWKCGLRWQLRGLRELK